jgi:hypothetical protein
METFLKCSLVSPRGRRKNFMKMDLGEISGEKWKWIGLAEVRTSCGLQVTT